MHLTVNNEIQYEGITEQGGHLVRYSISIDQTHSSTNENAMTTAHVEKFAELVGKAPALLAKLGLDKVNADAAAATVTASAAAFISNAVKEAKEKPKPSESNSSKKNSAVFWTRRRKPRQAANYQIRSWKPWREGGETQVTSTSGRWME
jgi:hypothetical protein